MINSSLCHEGSPSKKREKNNEDGDDSRKKSKQKRPKIISPRRQKYETQFEKFFVQRHVEDKLQEKPLQEVKKENGKFDTITKVVGSLNAKVVEKLKQEVEKKKLRKQQKL